jgi:hypothetical protein
MPKVMPYFGATFVGCVLASAASASNIQNVGLVSTFQYPFGGHYSNAIAIDPSGNMISAGVAFQDKSGLAFEILKASGAGQAIWTNESAGYLSGNQKGLALVTDSSGNIYATGPADADGSGFNWLSEKLSPSGAIIWRTSFDGPGDRDDFPCGIAIDSYGSCYVAGTVDQNTTDGTHIAEIKYLGTGGTLAANLSIGDPGSTAQTMCLDHQGQVWIGGTDGEGNSVMYVLNINGSQVAQHTLGTGLGKVLSIKSDSLGNVVAAGYVIDSVTSLRIATVAYFPAAATPFWIARVYADGGMNDQADYVDFDPSGNVITSVSEANTTQASKNVVAKFDNAGNQKWATAFTGLNAGNQTINPGGLAIDKYGDAYISGYSFYGPGYANAAYMVKYNASGTQLFLGYHGVLNAEELPCSLAIDANGDLYTSGMVRAASFGCQTMFEHWAQAPIANYDSYSLAHNGTLTVATPGVLANDTFSHGATATLHTGPTHGTLTLQPGGAFTYKPTSGYTGTDTFQYVAGKSGGGGSSNVAIVTITVT